jgi:hypothetical protein
MFTPDPDKLLEAIAEALQTMAFVTIEPLTEPVPAGERLCIIQTFSGPVRGQFQLDAPRALGALIAANLLASEPDAPEAQAKAEDALREVTNVTAGLMLRSLCGPEQMPQMTVPIVTTALGRDGPGTTGCHVSLSAESQPVTVTLRMCA